MWRCDMNRFRIKDTNPFVLPLGKCGEMLAWEHLINNGFTILQKNYTCLLGEIDVVALDEADKLVFVEVKTRRHHRFGLPEEAVDLHKRRKLVRLAQFYMKEKGRSGESASFAVVSITWKAPKPDIRFIRNAFSLEQAFRDR